VQFPEASREASIQHADAASRHAPPTCRIAIHCTGVSRNLLRSWLSASHVRPEDAGERQILPSLPPVHPVGYGHSLCCACLFSLGLTE